jgi:hypothetical protein
MGGQIVKKGANRIPYVTKEGGSNKNANRNENIRAYDIFQFRLIIFKRFEFGFKVMEKKT